MRRRCPWCSGPGAWFTGWFGKAERCRTCGLRWTRGQDGWELGTMMIAAVLTGGAIMVSIVVGLVVSYPDVAVVPMVVVGAALAVLVPIVTYPVTYTLFSAFDIAVHPPTEVDFPAVDTGVPAAGGVPETPSEG